MLTFLAFQWKRNFCDFKYWLGLFHGIPCTRNRKKNVEKSLFRERTLQVMLNTLSLSCLRNTSCTPGTSMLYFFRVFVFVLWWLCCAHMITMITNHSCRWGKLPADYKECVPAACWWSSPPRSCTQRWSESLWNVDGIQCPCLQALQWMAGLWQHDLYHFFLWSDMMDFPLEGCNIKRQRIKFLHTAHR